MTDGIFHFLRMVLNTAQRALADFLWSKKIPLVRRVPDVPSGLRKIIRTSDKLFDRHCRIHNYATQQLLVPRRILSYPQSLTKDGMSGIPLLIRCRTVLRCGRISAVFLNRWARELKKGVLWSVIGSFVYRYSFEGIIPLSFLHILFTLNQA
jgi:hypothetical protein